MGRDVACELCGKEVPTSRVAVDDVAMRACASCAKFGKPLAEPPRPVPSRAGAGGGGAPGAGASGSRWFKDVYAEIETDLIPDYPRKIRAARERAGWSREELGKRLNEKVSIVEKLESGAFRPDDAMARKIQKVLGVKVLEALAPAITVGGGRPRSSTLRDIAVVKKKG